MFSETTCYLIFATDGKGSAQLAHVYAETFEQASRAAAHWRDSNRPELTMLKVRAEPNGFLFGHTIPVEMTEEKENDV